jgi:hypothetical protein
MSNGPELPVIYENPRFDKATPTLKPVADRAIRFTGVILMEWGTLTLIEESPRYLKVATIVVAGLILAVHESWPWLRMRDWRWYPSLMATFVVGYFVIFAYALYTEPSHKSSADEIVAAVIKALPATPQIAPTSMPSVVSAPNIAGFDQVRNERDALLKQRDALNTKRGPESKWLYLDDARRWQIAKTLRDAMAGQPQGCTVIQSFEGDNSNPDTRKSAETWGEVQQPIAVANWHFTQGNKTFFSPGLAIAFPATSGAAGLCARRLKDLLDSLNVSPVSMHADASTLDVSQCPENNCVEVTIGRLESP